MRNIIVNHIYQCDLDTTIQQITNLKKLSRKTVLVTGSTGLIGSYIVDLMHWANIKYNMEINIVAMGRNLQRLKQRFPYWEKDSKLKLLTHDIINPLENIDFKIDFIIHAASNAYPKVIYENPVETILANVEGTKNLLEYLKKKSGKRLLFISSGEVYGQGNIEKFVEEYCGPIDILDIRSCYPLSKRCAENLCIAYHQEYNLDVCIARLSHVYGPNVTNKDNRATAQFFEAAAQKKNIVLNSKGNQIRSYTYISDCIAGILTILVNGRVAEAYNVANCNSICSISDLAYRIAEQADVMVEHQNKNIQPSPFDRAVLDNRKILSLEWYPFYSLDIGIQHTLEIMRWLIC